MNIYLTKISKTKLKIRSVSRSKSSLDFKQTSYEKTRLSAKSFYKKNFSPSLNFGSSSGYGYTSKTT